MRTKSDVKVNMTAMRIPNWNAPLSMVVESQVDKEEEAPCLGLVVVVLVAL